ncbi:MAG TPA: hypothetical protein VFA04_01165 [Bryobacteraceae bacterium]|nr:hypothetical protein [Bryobacteraceae bacterium]
MTRRYATVLLLAAPLAAAQHLHFEDEHYFYDVTFDTGKVSAAQIRELVVLSPFLRVRVAGPHTFVETWRYGAPEDRQLEIRPLEACDPGEARCGTGAVDAAFLANAARNLERDKAEIRQLRKISVPKPLKPVREYLADEAEFQLKLQEARFRYFKSRDTGPLRKMMCEVCPCAGPESVILENLRTAPASDGAGVTNDWLNRTLGCHDALTRRYPIEAWKAFTVRFGVVEKYGEKQGP